MSSKLKVFFCHASEDKPAVRELYKRLAAESWIEPWLDEEDLLPGQDFDLEIYKATRDADAIIICLSKISVAKDGYVNKEIRRAYDIAQEKPEGAIYVIPLRLDECDPSFEYLKKLHWVDYFRSNAHEKLVKALRVCAETLEIDHGTDTTDPYRFIRIPPTTDVPYSFYIGKYPVTNAQYQRFLVSLDFNEKSFWINFPKYNEDCVLIGRSGEEGWHWLRSATKEFSQPLAPRYWDDVNFGSANLNNPVVGVTWYEANAYCKWLMVHWGELDEGRVNSDLQIKNIRLSLDFEWSSAGGGEIPAERYPWDVLEMITTDTKEIVKRSNVFQSNIGHTVPVNSYLLGRSQHGVMDMAGNVWEWQANYNDNDHDVISLRGGSWINGEGLARVSIHHVNHPSIRSSRFGFRSVIISG